MSAQELVTLFTCRDLYTPLPFVQLLEGLHAQHEHEAAQLTTSSDADPPSAATTGSSTGSVGMAKPPSLHKLPRFLDNVTL